MKDELNSLLQKKMDRKDFLKHVGIGFITITGVTTVLKSMNNLADTKKSGKALSYSSGSYGGKKSLS